MDFENKELPSPGGGHHNIDNLLKSLAEENTAAPMRREVDSLDDFEHLGHDTSPLNSGGGDNLLTAKLPRDLDDAINKGVGATSTTAAHPLNELLSFDPFASVQPKMDSNLLDSGKPEGDPKIDKFLDELSSFAKHDDLPEIPNKTDDTVASQKSATQNFMDFERGQYQHHDEKIVRPAHKIQADEEPLERYSDSEEEEEDDEKLEQIRKVPTPSAVSLPASIPASKVTAFKDFDDFEEPEPLPKKDYPSAPPEPAPKVAAPAPKAKAPEAASQEKKTACDTKTVIEAEAIFCKMGLDAWFNPERLNPKVESLIYWRDPKKSGPVFGGVLLVLLSLTYFSLISVVAYLSLLGLTGTISFRIYKNIVQAVQKTGDGHPFKELLEFDVSLPQEKVKEFSEVAVAHFNAAVAELRRLFLVEDLVDSIKFGVLLWTLTYLGAWFNGMTLIILAWVALFSLPKVYETNKAQIDANLQIVRTKLAEVTSKVKAAIPIGKKVEEKKEQ